MKCARCNRQLKNAAPSGYGPVCLRAVTGPKRVRVRIFDHQVKRSADDRQIEIVFEVRP